MAPPARPPPEQPKKQGVVDVVSACIKCASLYVVLAVCNYASAVALHPLYGGVTTGQHFRTTWSAAVALLGLIPSNWLPTTSPKVVPRVLGALALIISAAPLTAYKWGSFTARFHNPTWGPIAAQLATAVPINFLGTWLARTWLEPLELMNSHPSGPRFLTFMITFLGVSSFEDVVWGSTRQGGMITSCNLFMASGVAISLAALASSACAKVTKTVVQPTPESTKPIKLQKGEKSVPTSPPVPIPSTRPAPKSSALKSMRKFFPGLLGLAISYSTSNTRPCSNNVYPYITGQNDEIHVLARNNSLTGMVTVAENLETGFRYLRCDHSLLGGVWIGEQRTASSKSTKEDPAPSGGYDYAGEALGDSIYSAFVLQEAIRLFKRAKADPNEPKTKPSALMIGLGIGTATRAMALHNVSTTIVEIDPVIPYFAEKYFGLPPRPQRPVIDKDDPDYGYDERSLYVSPNIPQVHVQDARAFVHKKATILSGLRPLRESMRYDYIVHDCFSGGLVPSHLFTTEFWEDAKVSLKLNGVLAVNFAGKLGSNAARAILTTLEHSFSKCRVFHDRVNPSGDLQPEKDEFLNMVFFCTQSPDMALDFRSVKEQDALSSYLRQHIFTTMEGREVKRVDLLTTSDTSLAESDYLLRDNANKLNDWQKASAVDHWLVMRKVLPDYEWEAY